MVEQRETDRHYSPTEYRLLTELRKTPNKLRSKSDLSSNVLGKGRSLNTIKHVICNLRKRNPSHREDIVTLRGQGYMFKDPSDVTVKQEEDTQGIHLREGCKYYPERRLVVTNNLETYLTETENKILELLAQRPGRDVYSESIAQHLWNDENAVNSKNIIKWQIVNLRRKLEPDKKGPENSYIHTVRGVGYVLVDSSNRENTNSVTVFEKSSDLAF